MIDGMTLLMFRLRQVPDAILPSDKIAEMATAGPRRLHLLQSSMNGSGATIRASRKFSTQSELKLAFADEIALKRWQRELNAIIVQATEKPLTGSNHES